MTCFVCGADADVDPILFDCHQHGQRRDRIVCLCPRCSDAVQDAISDALTELRKQRGTSTRIE